MTFIILTVTRCKAQNFRLTDDSLRSGQVYTTYGIYYSLGGDSLLVDNCKQTLDSIYNFISTHPNFKYEVGNHTDFRGDDRQNLELSQRRADRLREYLISRGIDQGKIVSKGYGETNPLRSKKDQDKLGVHAKNVNRRTTLKLLK